MTYNAKLLKNYNAYLAAEQKYSRQIATAYREALNDTRAAMSAIYEKYAVDGVLTKAQMTQYNRLATMERDLEAILGESVTSNTNLIRRIRPDQYGEAYFRSAWAISTSQEVSVRWGMLSRDLVAADLANPSYERAIKTLKPRLIGAMRIAVEQGLAQGKSYTTMLRDVRGVFNTANWETLRIMRTELHTAQNLGTIAAYNKAQDSGIAGNVIWISTLDGRTRPDHQGMDGRERDADGFFRGPIGAAEYPGDPDLPANERINCRCATRFELDFLSDIPGVKYDDWIATRKIWK